MFPTERELIKQIINFHHKKYATGLFWQPLGVGNTAHGYAKQLARNTDKKYNLFTEYKSMVGLVNSRDGARVGMPSAAVEIVNSLSELVSFLGVFKYGEYFYLIAVRNGIIIRDILIDREDVARKTYTELINIPDWGALFAPSGWGIPKSQEKDLADLVKHGNFAKLHQISVVKSIVPSILFAVLFTLFGVYVLTHPISNNTGGKKPGLNSELAAEYRRQIELKKQEIIDKKLEEKPEEPIQYPYDNLPNVAERANLCYKAIAFVMQPIPGWNQTYAKCDTDYVFANFTRDFGTLNDFYEIGAQLMPGAIVQQVSDDEIIVRVKLPKLNTFASLDERDQVTVMRDIATNFQQININANIQPVTDTISRGDKTEDLHIVEVGASSKLIPSEFIHIFDGFSGVYMTSISWRANTRMWNYEVIIYTK
jgi:hypothetical protein